MMSSPCFLTNSLEQVTALISKIDCKVTWPSNLEAVLQLEIRLSGVMKVTTMIEGLFLSLRMAGSLISLRKKNRIKTSSRTYQSTRVMTGLIVLACWRILKVSSL